MARNYRSKLEQRAAEKLKHWRYEGKKLDYVTSHTYLPDFSKGKYLIEVKGRFRTSMEAAKYIDVQQQHPEYELVFLFTNPKTPMPHAKRRKDGTKYTHGEWAEKNGFTYVTLRSVEDWLKENVDV
jgi:hypothetical protein